MFAGLCLPPVFVLCRALVKNDDIAKLSSAIADDFPDSMMLSS